MISKQEYPKGYAPGIYMTNLTLRYCLKKYQKGLMDPDKRIKKKYLQFVKDIIIEKELLVLDQNQLFPNRKLYDEKVSLFWNKYGLKKKNKDDYLIGIRNIEIISKHGRVSYDWNI